MEAQAQARAALRNQQHRDQKTTTQKELPPWLTSSTEAVDGHSTGGTSDDSKCRCSCPHNRSPLSSSQAQAYQSNVTHGGKESFYGKVDESEVRELEKRVRGLEGRVRGFEGLPPDRELAWLEVERLRKELESLARRREGLFEGLKGDALEGRSMRMRAARIS